MNILLVSAEVEPFAKTGGLADVCATLPREWQRLGQNPIIVMPKYGFINVEKWGFRPTFLTLIVPMGYWTEFAHVWEGTLPNSNVPVYLIEHNQYFDRPGIYGEANEYPDNNRRFIFLARAAFEVAKALDFTPDIIHAHDFHTAFAMPFLKGNVRNEHRFSKTAGVFTIHNLAYQGRYEPYSTMEFSTFGMKEFYPGSWFEYYGSVNFMKVGIMFADKITTVSPTYAKEIRYPYYGEGLHDVLNYRGADLIGVLNGVYYNDWDPNVDRYIYKNYNIDSLYLKNDVKKSFLYENGLNDYDNLEMPLIGMVSRLTEQKGIDLVRYKIEQYLAEGAFRFALLGSGNKNDEDFFVYLKWKYPKLALIQIGYSDLLSHRIIAASDFFLMPSRFEPCGLTQMYSMKYGTIPIVRQTGGLADTVFEYNYATGEGNGFNFYQYNADDMAWAIRRALSIYNNQPHWDIIRQNAMKMDFSSGKTAMEYLKVFTWALEKV